MIIEWRPVAGYEGQYEISNTGRLRSLDRLKPYQDTLRFQAGREIRPAHVNGYPRVPLWRDGKSTWIFIHRLVALTFIGPAPPEKHQINHKNGDHADASVENLEWVSASENAKHAYRVLGKTKTPAQLASAPRGEANGRAKLSSNDVSKIRLGREAGVTCKILADRHGVNPATISRIHRLESRRYDGIIFDERACKRCGPLPEQPS